MNRTPTPTECTLRIVHAHQCLSTYTHMYTHVHPLWCVIAFIQFGVNGRDKSAPTPTECALRLFMYNQCLFHEHVIFTLVHPTFTPTYTHCDAWLYLHNSCERARWIGPYAYGMYAAIVYVQSMFIPRIYDICPRTPTFTHVHPL